MPSLRKSGFGKGFVYCKSIFESLPGATLLYSLNALRLGYSHFLPINLYKTTRSPIGSLFLDRCPSAIFGTIIAVIIDSVERMALGRSFAKIGNKVFKKTPSFTNLYSSAAIMLKGFVSYIITSAFHGSPRSIFGRSCKSVCFVFAHHLSAKFLQVASATWHSVFTFNHSIQTAPNNSSAVANTTKPLVPIAVDVQFFHNNKSAYSCSGWGLYESWFCHVLFWTNGSVLSSRNLEAS